MRPQIHYIICFSNQIKGPSPEMVEYIGMQNLINAIKNSVGPSEGKLLFGLKGRMAKCMSYYAVNIFIICFSDLELCSYSWIRLKYLSLL